MPGTDPSTDLVRTMADRFAMLPDSFAKTCKSICFPDGKATDEQFLAFLAIASGHNLNPFTREIYAFPRPHGGIQAIVSIDGWMKIINSHPQFDGMEFVDKVEGGKLLAITCRIYRKDRKYPVECTEYLRECLRQTEPWQKWPGRMLRHKAAIQAARYAFGFAGIVDPDESQRYDVETTAEAVVEDERAHAAPKSSAQSAYTDGGGKQQHPSAPAASAPKGGDAHAESRSTGVDMTDAGGATEVEADGQLLVVPEADGGGSPTTGDDQEEDVRDREIGKVEGERIRQLMLKAGLKADGQRNLLREFSAISFENLRYWQLPAVTAAIEARGK